MAETKKAETAVKAEPERVEMRIHLDNDPNSPKEEFFSVNGKNYIIQKGVTVFVPPEVKEVYENRLMQEAKTRSYTESKMLNEPQ